MCFSFYISKAAKFQRYTETELFAHFNKDVQSVKKVSLKFSTGNVFKPKYKLRVLRIRLTHLERKERYETCNMSCFHSLNTSLHLLLIDSNIDFVLHRLLCRYDVLLQENKEVTFRPLPCEESNF